MTPKECKTCALWIHHGKRAGRCLHDIETGRASRAQDCSQTGEHDSCEAWILRPGSDA